MPRRLTPQEKKRRSLEKDHRDDYGQNDKASRRLVPLRKKQANRAVRRGDKVDLRTDPEVAEERLPKRLASRWKKCAGQSLGDSLKHRSARREMRVNRTVKQGAERRAFRRYLAGEITGAEYRETRRRIWSLVED